jgi:hypothetical protein
LPLGSPSYRHRLQAYTYDPISPPVHCVVSGLILAVVDLIDCKPNLLQHRLSFPSCYLAHSTGSCALASSEYRGSYANDSANGWLCLDGRGKATFLTVGRSLSCLTSVWRSTLTCVSANSTYFDPCPCPLPYLVFSCPGVFHVVGPFLALLGLESTP